MIYYILHLTFRLSQSIVSDRDTHEQFSERILTP